ncbi:hypothetical protein PBRA_004885 [Plasmodiophora brassicae]|uniref:Uncharacterized protein n=1 Tax=Plasmodiophora brassicae TaxID=37360 RepID=A0A0G4IM36_PLABS|nr:hypothetical protein PBRA_004885 [Plasmodiophora brassicae]
MIEAMTFRFVRRVAARSRGLRPRPASHGATTIRISTRTTKKFASISRCALTDNAVVNPCRSSCRRTFSDGRRYSSGKTFPGEIRYRLTKPTRATGMVAPGAVISTIFSKQCLRRTPIWATTVLVFGRFRRRSV